MLREKAFQHFWKEDKSFALTTALYVRTPGMVNRKSTTQGASMQKSWHRFSYTKTTVSY